MIKQEMVRPRHEERTVPVGRRKDGDEHVGHRQFQLTAPTVARVVHVPRIDAVRTGPRPCAGGAHPRTCTTTGVRERQQIHALR